MSDCTDVCETVMDRLLALGFPLSLEDEDHEDILEALRQVWFIRKDAMKEQPAEADLVCDECGFSIGEGDTIWIGPEFSDGSREVLCPFCFEARKKEAEDATNEAAI